jgi:hypothetical protein
MTGEWGRGPVEQPLLAEVIQALFLVRETVTVFAGAVREPCARRESSHR